MSKYIPPEKMTERQLRAELEKSFQRWNEIAENGCRDPFWPDGVNMNLVRNHIIFWYKLLADKDTTPIQLSLFEPEIVIDKEWPIPPKVPDQYMVAGCEYSDRLKNRNWDGLIWGRKGEYRA